MKNRSRRAFGVLNKTIVKRDQLWAMPKLRSSWSIGRTALILAVLGFCLIVVLFITREKQQFVATLPQSAFTAATPINTVDPTSGKAVVAGIASTYTGYTIGHCCTASKGKWEALSDLQKDSAVQQFLR